MKQIIKYYLKLSAAAVVVVQAILLLVALVNGRIGTFFWFLRRSNLKLTMLIFAIWVLSLGALYIFKVILEKSGLPKSKIKIISLSIIEMLILFVALGASIPLYYNKARHGCPDCTGNMENYEISTHIFYIILISLFLNILALPIFYVLWRYIRRTNNFVPEKTKAKISTVGQEKIRKEAVKTGAGILGAICFLILCIPFFVRMSVKDEVFSRSSTLPKKEFAIILGAGLKPDGTPGNYLKQRLDDGIDLYRKQKINKFLLSGDNGKQSYDEISAMNNYLLGKNVPQNIIYGDYAGFDTFSTMARASKIFNVRDAVVISQKFHLVRAVYLARQKGINAIGYSTSAKGDKKYFIREWFATIKSVADCAFGRKPKFSNGIVETTGKSNIKIK